MRKVALIFIFVMCTVLTCACDGKGKNENDIINDLQGKIPEFEDSTITDVSITKRQTNQEDKEDNIWCNVSLNYTTKQKTEVQFSNGYFLKYIYYDDGGWLLEEVTSDENVKAKRRPLSGVNEEFIIELYSNEDTTVTIQNHITDLKNETDSLIINKKTNSDNIEFEQTLQLEFEFKHSTWYLKTSQEISKEYYTFEVKNQNGDILIDGKHIEKVETIELANVSTGKNEWRVEVTLTKEGGKLFEKITAKYLNQSLDICINSNVICTHLVETHITDGIMIVYRSDTKKLADNLTKQINSSIY